MTEMAGFRQRVADVLERDRRRIMRNWASRVGALPAFRQRPDLDLASVLDDMPAIFDALLAAIRREEPAGIFPHAVDGVKGAAGLGGCDRDHRPQQAGGLVVLPLLCVVPRGHNEHVAPPFQTPAGPRARVAPRPSSDPKRPPHDSRTSSPSVRLEHWRLVGRIYAWMH